MTFYLLLKIWAKILAKISKNLSGKYSPGMLATRQKILDHAKQSATDIFKTASKDQFKKQQKHMVIW